MSMRNHFTKYAARHGSIIEGNTGSKVPYLLTTLMESVACPPLKVCSLFALQRKNLSYETLEFVSSKRKFLNSSFDKFIHCKLKIEQCVTKFRDGLA